LLCAENVSYFFARKPGLVKSMTKGKFNPGPIGGKRRGRSQGRVPGEKETVYIPFEGGDVFLPSFESKEKKFPSFLIEICLAKVISPEEKGNREKRPPPKK